MNRILITFFGLICTVVMISCQNKVDLIVHNASVYTLNDKKGNASAFVVNDGRFIAVGGEELLEKYSGRVLDLQGLSIYPGFIDSHCHFMSLGLSLQQVDLRGTQSFEEVLDRVKDFAKNKNLEAVLGRGWDQTIGKTNPFQKNLNSMRYFLIFLSP